MQYNPNDPQGVSDVRRWSSSVIPYVLAYFVSSLLASRKVIVIESEDHVSVALSSGRSSASASAFERVCKIDVDPRLIGYKPENVKLLGKNFPLLL